MRATEFKHFDDMIAAMMAAKASRSAATFLAADDPSMRMIGFVALDTNQRFQISVTAINAMKVGRKWVDLVSSPTGRRKIANCVSHGHEPDGIGPCETCKAWDAVFEVMIS